MTEIKFVYQKIVERLTFYLRTPIIREFNLKSENLMIDLNHYFSCCGIMECVNFFGDYSFFIYQLEDWVHFCVLRQIIAAIHRNMMYIRSFRVPILGYYWGHKFYSSCAVINVSNPFETDLPEMSIRITELGWR